MRITKEDLPSSIATVHAINYQKIKTKSNNLNLKEPNLYDFVQKIGYKMVKTCILDNGIGLSAPQLGIFKRMFVIQDKNDSNVYDVYLNPIWKPLNKIKCSLNEACLSVPGKEFSISRFKTIEVEYWCFDPDKKLINIKQELNDYWARVFQHEYDHLESRSIVDVYKKQNDGK